MTEKRFTINLNMENKREWLLNNYAIAKLTDNSDKTFYFIIDSVDEIENLCKKINSLVDENEQLKQRISELKEDNDHKFWKLQFMHQFNTTQLIVHEISMAIEQGYEVSDKFQEYINELKAHNEKGREKAIEQEKW